MNNSTFFSTSVAVSVFYSCYPNFFQAKKLQVSSINIYGRSISVCDIYNEGMPKNPFSLDFPSCWNSSFCNNTEFNFLIDASVANFLLAVICSIKKLLIFFPASVFWQSENFKVLLILIYLDFETFFSATSDFISSVKASFQNFKVVDGHSSEKHCFSFLHHTPGSPKIALKSSDSDSSRLHFLLTTGFIPSV